MAKKKSAKAAKGKSKPKAKASKPARRHNDKPKTARPRAQVLPGMEQVRRVPLDKICAAIADIRDERNRGIREEKGLQYDAARYMEANKVPAYTASGVELALIAGEAHLRVRLVKEQTTAKATAPAKSEPADEPATADEMGEGQEPGEISDALTEDEEGEDQQ